MDKKILVTGGLGYIGSHTCIELINNGFNVSIIDNLVNSEITSLKSIEKITGIKINFYKVDLTDYNKMKNKLEYENFDIVIHFAALKSVSESINFPEKYMDNNIGSLKNILKFMEYKNIKKLLFSSSCTVYGKPDSLPVTEESIFKKPESPYAETKQISEKLIDEFSNKFKQNSISLRYFNPVGAHDSGLIGEKPKGKPENLVPYITETAIGLRKSLSVFGSDYKTKDGTPVRDYIHIVDLANAHLAAVIRLTNYKSKKYYEVFNIGTGKGYSVLEVINAFKKVNKVDINYKIVGRRKGDIDIIFSDNTLSRKTLNWKPKKTIEDMMVSSWRWQKNINR